MPKRAITAEDLLQIQLVGDPQFSPDGHHLLFSHRRLDAEKNRYVTKLYDVDLEGHIRQWTGGEGSESHGRYSPDGRWIAFISAREEKKGQLFLLPTSGGEGRRLTNLPEGSLSGFKWSPDGKRIAFTFRETHPDWTSAAVKERQEKNRNVPMVTESMWYRLDGDGYFLEQRYQLYVVEIETGETTRIYEGDGVGFFDYDWNPSSIELVIAANANARPMFDKPHDELLRVALDGQIWVIEGQLGGSKEKVAWSPDGKWLAYLGNAHAEHWGAKNTRLYVIPADGGETLDLSAGTDYDLAVPTLSDAKEFAGESALLWSPDSKGLYVQVGWHGAVQIGFAHADQPGIELLTEGEHFLALGNLSPDGDRIAAVLGDALHPLEIAVYEIGQKVPHRLTRFNDAFLEEVKLSRPEELWLESSDGHPVHAWVMYPTEYLPPRRYPAILEVHGGPHTQYGWTFFHEFQLLAAQGYVVVYSNPRGSRGYGEAHTEAIAGTWGDRDWEDIQTVMRWMQHQSFIHPGQMGIMGGSYGGYMTNWAIGHTRDFKAAITDRCVSNLVSFAGNHDFVMVKDGYFKGSFFGDMSHLWKSSPIAYFDGVTTPTLIIHSEGDLRCNIEQAEQVFAALQHQEVESRFVRYPETTSHGLSRNGPIDMRLHRLGEIVAWWERHLQ